MQRQIQRWERLTQELSHPAVELTIDEFAPVLATFHALKRAGMKFDPMLCALMGVLERQVFDSPDDSDSGNNETSN